jgi:hypothetical protein
LVASNKETLDNNQGDIWDSKKVNSNQSVEIDFAGKPLESAKKYYWKVMIWNGKGQPSAWSEVANWQMGLLTASDWKNAQWIAYKELPDSMRGPLPTFDNAKEMGIKGMQIPIVPLFRKEFTNNKKIANATLFITGLGQYEVYINGKKIGNDFLTPGWTLYDKTILYNTYNVTRDVSSGENVIGVIVGNGFYYIPRERYRKMSIAAGMPSMICRLKITYVDGTVKNIVSDSNWKTAPSPITFSSIYGGEDYDARLEQPSWDNFGFNDSSWKPVILPVLSKSILKADPNYPVAVEETISPKHIQMVALGRYLYDFGQNASGIIELKVKGQKGQQIKIVPGELLTPQHEINQSASGSPYYFLYTLKGNGVETWQPMFTYYGFRYAMIENAEPDSVSSSTNSLPRIIELHLLHTRNVSPQTGDFQCSNPLCNRIFTLIRWAIKNNMQSVLTDCPHREKLGWLEQTYLMGDAIHYNYDIHNLYAKMVQDMMDSQLSNGLVPDIAPEYVAFHGGFRDSPEWGSAAVILPWLIYKWYGDKTVMERAWPMMVKYVKYLGMKSTNHILDYGLGDWYDLGPKDPGESQLTPVSLTATATYYYDLDLLIKMADLFSKEKEKEQFSLLAKEVKKAFNHKFFNKETNCYATGSQTAMSMPLCFDLVEKTHREKVLTNLIDTIKINHDALTAGDIGFHYLVQALADCNASQLLFDMINRSDVPGYGYQLKKGATSLTESWTANAISSNDHLMLGHLMEWFYTNLGGIQQAKNSIAFKTLVIKPSIVGDITSAKTNFETPYGNVATDWKINQHAFYLNVMIPCNTSAMVYLPITGKSTVFENGILVDQSKNIHFVQKDAHYVVYKVGSGRYGFMVK